MAIENYEGYFDDDSNELNESNVVIDPAWESQQKKTFTAWCNAHLRKANENIVSIEQDFRDGLRLMRLLEVISGEQLPRPDRGKMRVHKIANVNKAFAFIESKGVKLVSIGAEEIVDGNAKMILGMIWTIILRFAIQDIQIEDSTAKKGLLLWCKRQTATYKNVNVENFDTSFKDGLAFCAIIHRNRPDLINYSALSADNPLKNMNIAFTAAEKELDIPIMLDAEDMVASGKPDERSVMAYLSSYYHTFSGVQKANVASTRIANIVKIMKENARLQEEYESISTNLLKWITVKCEYFLSRTQQQSVTDVETAQSELRLYRRNEKPNKLQEKAHLETTYNTLLTRLRLNNRQPFVPSQDKLIMTIAEKWKELECAEKQHDEFLVDERQRLQRTDYLLNKFNIHCSTHEAWAADKPEKFAAKEHLSASLTELRAMMKMMEAFEYELLANDDRIVRIDSILSELKNLMYHNMDTLDARYNDILTITANIKRNLKEVIADCNRILPIREEIDQLHIQFAKQAVHFQTWLQQTEEDLQDAIIVYTTAELKRYKEAHCRFRDSLLETDKACQFITYCSQEVERLVQQNGLHGVVENPYSNVKLEDWAQIQVVAKARIESLHEKEQQQLAHDKFRAEFIQKASALDKVLQEYNAEVRKIAMDASGTLEEQIGHLKKLELQLATFRNTMNELEQTSVVLENYAADTSSLLPALRVALDELFVSVHHSINMLENQIITRDSKGLTKEQLRELRACFQHFDKNNSQKLDKNEFKACLVSLGHSAFDDSLTGETEFAKVMEKVDPGNTGHVTFDAFLDYMTREIAGGDTEEQIIQSFKVMAGDKGYISDSDIRHYLSPGEAEFCITIMNRVDGPMGDGCALDYEAFVDSVYGRSRKNGQKHMYGKQPS